MDIEYIQTTKPCLELLMMTLFNIAKKQKQTRCHSKGECYVLHKRVLPLLSKDKAQIPMTLNANHIVKEASLRGPHTL